MKKLLFLALLAKASVGVAQAADPGTAASANGTIATTVIAPLQMSHDSGAVLSFGTIIANGGGMITVSVANAKTTVGAANFFQNSATSVDSFTVTGDKSRTFSITMPTSVTLNGPSGATMLVSGLNGPPASATLSATGTYTFKVAGTLNVGNGQAAGAYTGTYTVNVAYN